MLDSFFPGVPVIMDAKRGDIARSSLNYAKEAFEAWGTDAVTVSPYMGTDSVSPFYYPDKGVYILDRTSNPGGADLQDLVVMDKVDASDVYPLYMAVAHAIAGWADIHEGVGAVVGATNMEELGRLAAYYAESGRQIPLLIPGVGSQGGSATEVMAALKKAGYPMPLARINSSSSLTHPWKHGAAPDDWLDLCIANLRALVGEASL
jgi:orotidine-5'-phosphate decarboxylase